MSGEAFIPKQAGVFAFHIEGNALFADSPKGIALHARGATLAGFFEGDVQVMGNINLIGPNCDITLQNEDCAEQFNLSDTAVGEPGMVMVIDDSGLLRPSEIAYDRRVAGVVSGAGDFKPAMMLGVKPSSPPAHGHRIAGQGLLPGRCRCLLDRGRRSADVLVCHGPRDGRDGVRARVRRDHRQGPRAPGLRPRADSDPRRLAIGGQPPPRGPRSRRAIDAVSASATRMGARQPMRTVRTSRRFERQPHQRARPV